MENDETNKKIIDYNIFVFDLDDTLYLHNVSEDYFTRYKFRIYILFKYLKHRNKKIYIATHNSDPYEYLNILDINEYIDGIIKEEKQIENGTHIENYTNKKDMIYEIMLENIENTLDDVIFFDDNIYNIKQVKEIGVKSVIINAYKGISLKLFSRRQ